MWVSGPFNFQHVLYDFSYLINSSYVHMDNYIMAKMY